MMENKPYIFSIFAAWKMHNSSYSHYDINKLNQIPVMVAAQCIVLCLVVWQRNLQATVEKPWTLDPNLYMLGWNIDSIYSPYPDSVFFLMKSAVFTQCGESRTLCTFMPGLKTTWFCVIRATRHRGQRATVVSEEDRWHNRRKYLHLQGRLLGSQRRTGLDPMPRDFLKDKMFPFTTASDRLSGSSWCEESLFVCVCVCVCVRVRVCTCRISCTKLQLQVTDPLYSVLLQLVFS